MHMNNIQEKHIKEYLDKNKMSLDEIQQAFLDSFTMNQVSNEEAAALMVSIMRNMMQMSHNADQLNELGIDPHKLSIDDVTQMMSIWCKEYAKSL
ncbi:hypothetical protein FD03_GL000593 [Companilactobacillus nodensis DSM 19682 = JCM 14932 = NBRC 107160]|uniref:Uncharacterized protein n=2 Tax=Companilactobacillus nodensis TaxID=460870 RepID=A0A0R1KK55_9LACO|nr:hypothetical protein FD03_GL000593 [Companilactobacillus nodensis DSM 19682 = JCM 14932 = NBRC 107160]